MNRNINYNLSVISIYDINNYDSLVPLLTQATSSSLASMIDDKNINMNINFIFLLLSPSISTVNKNTFLISDSEDKKRYHVFSISLKNTVDCYTTVVHTFSDAKVKAFMVKNLGLLKECQERINSKHLVKNILQGEDKRLEELVSSLSISHDSNITINVNKPILYKLGINAIPPNFFKAYPKRILVNLSYETLANIVSNSLEENNVLTSFIITTPSIDNSVIN